jgi:predicted DCC family thiol-disulfide oxidoreductase YuxK
MTAPKRTIYYDGLCQLCSREIDVFRRRVTDGSLAYVDIADPGFDAAGHGVDADRVYKHMHVRDEASGRMFIGVDALIGMWECVPGFRWLAAFARLPVLRQLMDVWYAVFAWVRPKLPKRKQAGCQSGRCAVDSNAPHPSRPVVVTTSPRRGEV